MSISACINNWVKQEILFVCNYNVILYSIRGFFSFAEGWKLAGFGLNKAE